MFKYFREKRILRLLKGAQKYLAVELRADEEKVAEEKPKTKFSRELDLDRKEVEKQPHQQEPEIKHSVKSRGDDDGGWAYSIDSDFADPEPEDKKTVDASGDIQFSLKDKPASPTTEPSEKAKPARGNDVRYSVGGLDDPKLVRRDCFKESYVDVLLKNFASEHPGYYVPAAGVTKALNKSVNMSFVDKMLEYINHRQLRDSQVYRAAQIDRRLFSKIVSDRSYKPSKDTCIAIVIALKLDRYQANDLLSRAGYTLSHSSARDVIIEYFIREREYNLNYINEVLFRLDQKPLGR